MGIGDWGLGIGDWGLGIGPNPQSPMPNPQSPIPNPQSPIPNPHKFSLIILINFQKKIYFCLNNDYIHLVTTINIKSQFINHIYSICQVDFNKVIKC